MAPGSGQLALNLYASPALLGGGATYRHRITAWAAAYADARAGWVPGQGATYRATAGARFRW